MRYISASFLNVCGVNVTSVKPVAMSCLEDFMSGDIKPRIDPNEIRKTGDVTLPETSLKEIMYLSEQFPLAFPISSAKCNVLRKTVVDEVLERNIKSSYPIIHEKVLVLYSDFLKHKRRYGSKVEKNLYKTMTVVELVDRLLRNRAIIFVGATDAWKLRNGKEGLGKWETIGTKTETGFLKLENYLSYDEIKLSAFLSISSYTYFLNDGSRRNKGILEEDRTKIEDEGIIVALVGARLIKSNVMEYQDIIIEEEQNTGRNGYGSTFVPTMASLYAGFYNKINMTYKQFLRSSHYDDFINFRRIRHEVYFDNSVYVKRLSLSLDTFLLEANTRAKNEGRFAYVHLVGIGLGVWMQSTHQMALFAQTLADRIRCLGSHLSFVSDVDLAYVEVTSCGIYKNGDKIPIEGHPKEGISIYLTKNQPHTRLVGEHKGKLRVVSYAWEGNAFPGNEYWNGSLQSSSDPAAACSTQIAELHNPYINPMICGANLHVVTKDGVQHIEQYLSSI